MRRSKGGITELTFPRAVWGRRLSHSDLLGVAAEVAGLTESSGEVFIYDIANLALEVGEQDTAGAQILCFCWLSAVLLLRIGRRSPSRRSSKGCLIPGWHRSASHLLLLLLLLITLLHLTVNTQPSLCEEQTEVDRQKYIPIGFLKISNIYTDKKHTFVFCIFPFRIPTTSKVQAPPHSWVTALLSLRHRLTAGLIAACHYAWPALN